MRRSREMFLIVWLVLKVVLALLEQSSDPEG